MNNHKYDDKENRPIAGRSETCPSNIQKMLPNSSASGHSSNLVSSPPSRPLQTSQKMNYMEQLGNQAAKSAESRKEWKICDFDFIRLLVKGKFANVYYVRERKSHYRVTLKILRKSNIIHFDIEDQVKREVEVHHHQLRHPNILRMYNYFHDETHIYFLLEYAKHGTLFKLLKECGRFDEKTAAMYVKDLTKALIFCHSKKFIHCHIKPENIWISHNYELKIADFGWLVDSPSSKCMTLCGTLDYFAPELFEDKPHSYAVDIWSLGVLCYELLVGLTPFDPKDIHQTYRTIKNVTVKYPDYTSNLAKDFIGKLVVVEPENRLPLVNVLQHPWIKKISPEGVPPPKTAGRSKMCASNVYKEQPGNPDAKTAKSRKIWTIYDFDLVRPLVKGKFANVYYVRERKSHYPVTLKIVRKSDIIHFKIEQRVRVDIEIHHRLRYPNILRMYNYFHDETHIYLLLEYTKHGALFKLLKERKRFDEKTAANCVRDLTKALIFCHSKKVIHCHIKPENILIGNNYELKITDFGWLVHSPTLRHITLCGTLDYLAPELFEDKPHSYAVDIWSLGVLCYELLVGFTQFKLTHQTCRTMKNIIVKYPDHTSDLAKDLITKLVVVEPENRLPLVNVLEHPWIKKNAPEGVPPPIYDLVEKEKL